MYNHIFTSVVISGLDVGMFADGTKDHEQAELQKWNRYGEIWSVSICFSRQWEGRKSSADGGFIDEKQMMSYS